MGFRRPAIIGGVILLLGFPLQAGTAGATHVGCGQVITQNTTLDSDVGPCPGNGIVIGADNVTLDLNGHTVFGSPPAGGTPTNSTIGINVDRRSGALVRNGTVAGFGTGVQLLLLNGSIVERLVVRDNLFTGIFVASFQNVIRGNIVERNGGYGVAIGAGHGNIIEGNVIRSNGLSGFNLERGGLNTRTGGTTVQRNSITANGADGIQLGGITGGASVVSNYVSSNRRNGIALAEFSGSHLVQANQVFGNSANGIVIHRSGGDFRGFHRILDNTAFRNVLFDLADQNELCDANTWAGNRFGTRNQPCIN